MAMTLRQIVDEADINVPNVFTDAQKVQWLDQLQRQLYREFTLPEQVEQLETVTGVFFYSLPSYIIPNRIKSVVLTDADGDNPQKYDYAMGHETVRDYIYIVLETATETKIGIHPRPTESGRLIFITFEDGPNTLSASDMTTVPRFFPDYHGLLVDGLSRTIAQKMNDVARANNYDANFQEALEKAKLFINKTQPYQMEDLYGGDLS